MNSKTDRRAAQPAVPATAATAAATAAAGGWHVIVAKSRVDSFNHDALIELLRRAQEQQERRIALDLRATRFLSLAMIQFLVQFAKELAAEGGQFALIAPAEKTKRHFEIYGSLAHITIFREAQSLPIQSRAEIQVEER